MPDEDITLDYVMNRLVIYGHPESVVNQVLGFYEQVDHSANPLTKARIGTPVNLAVGSET